MVDEIERIAAFADGSPELKEFNERIASRVAERERQALKFVSSPPGFGVRSGSSDWMDQLLHLERTPGTRKSLALKPEFARRARPARLGRELLARRTSRKWKLTGVDALRRRRAAEPGADAARGGRARGAPRRGDRAARRPYGTPTRRRR